MGTQIAVLILTQNEEKNIVDCISSVSFADEILVIDSGSTDQTQLYARKAGAKVFIHPMDEQGFAGQRNFALTQTKADWVFYLDADERVSEALADEIIAVTRSAADAVYEIKRISVVMGQQMHYGVYRPDYIARLFPRTSVEWIGVVHEQAEVKLPVQRLNSPALHYSDTSWEQYLAKLNQYTTLMADKMQQQGKHTGLLKMQLHAWHAFWQMYIIKQGFRDGRQGFLLCLYHYFYTLTKYVKLYYKQNERNMGDNI